MPSFDIVSELDTHELSNAVDQANREVSSRFDLKDTGAKFEHQDNLVKITAEGDFQVKQLRDILRAKLVKRNIDPNCMDPQDIDITGKTARQDILVREGIDQPLAKKIVKLIKDSKMKVQASIQGDKVRVNGKKRDDLQQAIQMIKKAELEWPLQFNNFRD